MSLETHIDRITANALRGVGVRAGNGMSLSPGDSGRILSRRGISGGQSDSGALGYPRSGPPTLRAGSFLLNLIPAREVAEDLSERIALSNVKVYVEIKLLPVSYLAATGPDLYSLSYAQMTNLGTVIVPHGTVLTNMNGTVNFSTGVCTEGTYYFYYAKVFSNGATEGFFGADSQSDLDYFYTNITSIGWIGAHYPPIDIV